MEGFASLTKEIKDTIREYRRLSISGAIIEFWEKDENGEWHDKTAIKKAEQLLETAETRADKLRRRYDALRALSRIKRDRANKGNLQ